jgi:hypothetical protein
MDRRPRTLSRPRVLVDDAVLHDERDAAQRGDVLEGVGVHGNQIGLHLNRHMPQEKLDLVEFVAGEMAQPGASLPLQPPVLMTLEESRCHLDITNGMLIRRERAC